MHGVVPMLGKIVLPLALLAAILLVSGGATANHTDGDPNTSNSNAETWMIGSYTITVGSDLTTLTFDARIGVNKITISPAPTTDAATLRTGYQNAPNKETYIAPYRSKLGDTVNTTFAGMFPGKPVTYSQLPREDTATLGAGSSGPVEFTLRASVTLTGAEEGLGSYGSSKVSAAFKAGAAIEMTRTFSADPGHTNTFTLAGPPFANFTAADSPGTIANGRVTVLVDAADKTTAGLQSTSALKLTLRDTFQTLVPTTEDLFIRTNVSLLTFELENGVCCKDGLPLTVDVAAEIRSIGVAARMGALSSSVPSAVKLPTHLSADALRHLRAAAIVEDSHLTSAEASINSQIKQDLDRTFSATTTVTTTSGLAAGLATGGVSHPLDSTPPAKFSASSSKVYYGIGTNSNTADAGLRAGAIVFFNITLEEGATLQQLFTFKLPSNLAFMNRTTPANGDSLTFDVPDTPLRDGKKVRDVAFKLGDASVARPTSEAIRNVVVVELPSLRGLAGTSVPLNLSLAADIVSLDVPGRFPGVLPGNVKLPYLSGDGFRILRNRGVITDANFTKASRDLVGEANTTLLKAFPGGVSGASGGFVASTLATGAPAGSAVRFAYTAVALHNIGEKPDRADAAFEAGAIVSTTFDLTSTAKQLTNYTIRLPTGLVFYAGPTAGASTKDASVDARTSATDVKQSLAVRFGKNMSRPTAPDLGVSINVAIGKLADGKDGMPITVDVLATFTAIDVAARFPGVLPSNVELPFLASEGFRTLYARGVITDLELKNASKSLSDDVKSRLVSAIGPRVNVTSGFDNASLTGTGPVLIKARAAAVKDLGVTDPNVAGKVGIVAEVILEAGAVVKQSLDLTGMKDADIAYSVTLPSNLAFRNVTGADGVASDSKALSLRLDGRGQAEDPKKTVGFKIVNPSAGSFTKAQATIDINLDLQLDLELIKAIQTQDAAMVMDLDALVTLGVIEVPADLAGQLPADVEIKFIPADALRRLWQEGVLNESAIKKIEDEFLKQVADGLQGVAGSKVNVTGGLERSQLNVAPAKPLSGDVPLKLTAKATIRKSLAGGTGAAALVLTQIPLDLPLQSFQNLPTTYKVILPKGLEVADVTTDNDADSDVERGTTPDGRSFLVAKVFNGKTVNVHTALAITSDLLIDKFLPWLILAGILVVGLIALPVWGIVRLVKRAKGGAGGEGGAE